MFAKLSNAHKMFTKHTAMAPSIFSKLSHAHSSLTGRGFESPRSHPSNGLEIRRKQ